MSADNPIPARLRALLAPHLSLSILALAVLATPRPGLSENRGFTGPRTLNRRIERVLRQSEAVRGFWGIELVSLPDGKVLYALNSDHLFAPASNMKLFTTAAAIEKLGPDFVFRTTVESEAAPDAAGQVRDLFIVGRGDPNLSGRALPYQANAQAQSPADHAFQSLADQLITKGVGAVTGRIVADDTYFLYQPYSHGWAQEDLQWGYGAPVSALAFNDNALTLRVQPGSVAGERARVWLEPVGDYYQLQNRVETIAAGGERKIFVDRAPGAMEVQVWGQIPVGADQDEEHLAILDPPRLAADLFRRDLESRGIIVRGSSEVRRITPFERSDSAQAPPAAPRTILAEYDSPPLALEIKVLNKVSQNLHAEMLLRTLAHEAKNEGSLAAGLETLQEFTAQLGIAPGEVRFMDGSGLSRKTLVSPSAVIKLLQHMAQSSHFSAFLDSLPVAGQDGTLAERFQSVPAQNRIHAKTGTIEHVNALSGYMDLPSGRRLAFSIIANANPLSESPGAATVDEIAAVLYDWFASRKHY